ncbi:MAG: SHOCT domain-containing protein [Anaerolineae bacterium]|nr:SHOCT domain-containing protein [Anaerolineae bacterium]
MRRFFMILGIILMVFAFVILTVFIILPSVVTLDDTPFLKNIMQSVACQPGEKLTASYSTYDTPTSTTRSTYMSCVNSEGQERDASQQLIGIGAVGYLGPFLVGLFMTLLAGNLAKKDRLQKANAQVAEATSTWDDSWKDRTNQASVGNYSEPAPAHVSLTQRLQELKEARNAGLITDAEYTTKRKALLNE